MAKMPQEVMDFFNDPEASKAIATVDAAGTLNLAPKGSLTAVDEETIAYACLSEGKTEANLKATQKAAATAFKRGIGYQIKGAFQGFQTSGPLFDRFAKLLEERAKVKIGAVGTVRVEEVYTVTPGQIGKKLA